MEMRSIERIERAIQARNNAFRSMLHEFRKNDGSGISAEVLEDFDATDREFESARIEMNSIAAEIRSGIRN